jgi:ketosteroid isomerase-like protein
MSERAVVPSVLEVVAAFTAAWDRHDLEATLAMVTDDCVFESARPGANGARVVGREKLRLVWAPSFASDGGAFEIEDTFAAGDRVVQLWRFVPPDGAADGVEVGVGAVVGVGVVRGVDVLRVRDGRVAEKFGYVKR